MSFARYRKHKLIAVVNGINLSVVIIGRNEASNLPRCFNSVKRMLEHSKPILGDSETIYIDSQSSDNSLQIAANYADTVCVLKSAPSAAAARQAGLLRSVNQWVLFLDGDMEIDKSWLYAVQSEFSLNPQLVGYTGIRNDIIETSEGGPAYLGQNVYGVVKKRIAPHFGGALLIRRAAALAAGGYDPRLKVMEEPDLHARLRAQTQYVIEIPKPFITHYTPVKRRSLNRLRGILQQPYFGLSLRKSILQKYFIGFFAIYKLRFFILLLHLLTVVGVVANHYWICAALQVGLLIVLKRRKRLTEWVISPIIFASVLFNDRKISRLMACGQEISVMVVEK